MAQRVRNLDGDGNVMPEEVAPMDLPDSDLLDATFTLVPDVLKVVDTTTGAPVIEFRGGASPVTDTIPTAPLGTAKMSSNLVMCGGYIRSSNFVAGSTGWNIGYNGDAEFNNVTVRGIVVGGGVDSTNYVTNGDFETNNTTGWVAASGTITNVTTAPRGGSRHLRLQNSNLFGSATYTLPALPYVGLYEAIFWVRSATSTEQIYLFTAGDILTGGIHFDVGTTYRPIRILFRTTAVNQNVTVGLVGISATANVYVDDVACYRVSEVYGGRFAIAGLPGDPNLMGDGGGVGPRLFSPGDVHGNGNSSGGVCSIGPDGNMHHIAEMVVNYSTLAVQTDFAHDSALIRFGSLNINQQTYHFGLNAGDYSAKISTDGGVSFATDTTVYTPVWTGLTTNPVLGNGLLTGYYCRIGQKVDAWGKLIMGSTTTFGTGIYDITVPVTIDTNKHPSGAALGTWTAVVATVNYGGIVRVGTSGSMRFTVAASGSVTPTVPGTFAAGDALYWNISYSAGHTLVSGEYILTDAFTDVDGVAIASRYNDNGYLGVIGATGVVSAQWTASGTQTALIKSNGLRWSVVTTTGGQPYDVELLTIPSTTNYAVSGTLVATPTVNNVGFGIVARATDRSNWYGLFCLRFTGVNKWYFFKNVADVTTNFVSSPYSSPAPAANDVMKLVCNGTTISAYINGVLLASTTDSSFTAQTKVGVGVYQGNPGVDSAVTTGSVLDSFLVQVP